MRELDFNDPPRGRFGDRELEDRRVERVSLEEFQVRLVHRTERAALCKDLGTGKEDWFPLSLVELSPIVGRRGEYTITMPTRIAKQKRWM